MASKASKKQSAKPKSKPKTKKVPITEVRRISKEAVTTLARTCHTLKKRMAGVSGDMGTEIRKAVERGLDAPSFRLAFRLYSKGQDDPAVVARMLSNFDYYRKALGLDKIAAKAPMLDLDAKANRLRAKNKKDRQMDLSERADVPAESEMPNEDQAGNVTQFPQQEHATA